MFSHFIRDIRLFVLATFVLLTVSTSTTAAATLAFEAEEAVTAAFRVSDRGASGGASVELANSGQVIRFAQLPAASKLAVRYASVTTPSTLSIAALGRWPLMPWSPTK